MHGQQNIKKVRMIVNNEREEI